MVDPRYQPSQDHLDVPYLMTLRDIVNYGSPNEDRTGVGTMSLFGVCNRYDLREYFPLLQCRRVPFKWTVKELFWILCGNHSAKPLEDAGVEWWRQWGGEDRDLGPVYGNVLRGQHWDGPSAVIQKRAGEDQLIYLIEQLKAPCSRRALATMWDPDYVEFAALPPCHGVVIQFKRGRFVQGVEYLDLCMYQRSADWILGVPVNIASYGFFLLMMAKHLGLKPGFFCHMVGDAHVYRNHLDAARVILDRPMKKSPKVSLGIDLLGGVLHEVPFESDLPWAERFHWDNIFEDIKITGYDPFDMMKLEVAV